MEKINIEQGFARIGTVLLIALAIFCIYAIYVDISEGLPIIKTIGQAVSIFLFWFVVIRAIRWIYCGFTK